MLQIIIKYKKAKKINMIIQFLNWEILILDVPIPKV